MNVNDTFLIEFGGVEKKKNFVNIAENKNYLITVGISAVPKIYLSLSTYEINLTIVRIKIIFLTATFSTYFKSQSTKSILGKIDTIAK